MHFLGAYNTSYGILVVQRQKTPLEKLVTKLVKNRFTQNSTRRRNLPLTKAYLYVRVKQAFTLHSFFVYRLILLL